MIVTRGDAASEWVEQHDLGIVVDYQDVEGVAQAIVDLVATPRKAFRERFERARMERSWEQSAQPLLRFCLNPRRAPDRAPDSPAALTWWTGLAAGFRSGLGQVDGGLWAAEGREVERLQEAVAGYEQGRFMRLMRWLHGVRQKVGGRR
jgi:hypothetical protein